MQVVEVNNIEITSQELINRNNILLDCNAKDFSNYSFWYYTQLNTANLILKNKCIYISNLSNMNDNDEAKLHEKDRDFIHCLCLCNSNTEKIPMWYLYAGISGQGASLQFTPAVLLKLIKSIKEVTTIDGKIVLHINKDFDIDYGWIFYRKNDSKTQVMYKRKWYSLKDPEEFEKSNYFIKSYPWEYEKEFRIVIHNKTKTYYDKLVLNISPILNKVRIKLAPEISKEAISKYSEINKLNTDFFNQSKLSINMNLFKRNFESFLEYIKLSSDNDQTLNYDEICNAISNNCRHKGEK